MDINAFKNFCSGCGLCGDVRGVKFERDEKGFPVADLNNSDVDFCEKFCPAGGVTTRSYSKDVWGRKKGVYKGWSKDDKLRFHASSGGVISSLCRYLIESKEVDGIIQICVDKKEPTETQVVVSRTYSDIYNCAGSRYCISQPLMKLSQILRNDEKYAFVGKPCDVATLRLYAKNNKNVYNNIKYYLSFFCAGEPSVLANKKLIGQLGRIENDDKYTLTYRGDGWPGKTVLRTSSGEMREMSYNESWGGILGRDIRYLCRFCADGIGEMADISCGDAWNMDHEGKPLFNESEGKNVIFARTEVGNMLLKRASKYIEYYEYQGYSDELRTMQSFQFNRRSCMKWMIMALKIIGKPAPMYDSAILNSWSNEAKISVKLKRFIGIIKRGFCGKL